MTRPVRSERTLGVLPPADVVDAWLADPLAHRLTVRAAIKYDLEEGIKTTHYEWETEEVAR